MKTAIRVIAIYALLSVILGVAALVQLFPFRPSSWAGWVLLFALVIPATLAGERVGELLFRNRVSAAIERRTRGCGLSWLRIGYVLVLALIVCAAIIGISGWF